MSNKVRVITKEIFEKNPIFLNKNKIGIKINNKKAAGF